ISQLPADCLNEIFEYSEDDAVNLRSFLLVNRLWCEVSVRILWKSIRNYNTLFACLPNDSKEMLRKNGIITSKPPMFNYASFCKNLSVDNVNKEIGKFLRYFSSQNLQNTVAQEIFQMLMNQTCLKRLIISSYPVNLAKFTSFP